MLATYLIVTVATVVIVRWLKKYLAYRALFNNLPGETDFSYLTGTMHKIPGTNEDGLAYERENARKYKYFHRVWAGPLLPALLLYHPDTIKAVIKSQAPKPRGKLLATAYDMGVRWLGEGLIIANGDRWARSRRLLTPAFHFDILKSYLDIYNKCADILINKISTSSSGGKSMEMYSLINMHALDIILRCAFSYNSDCQTLESGNEYVKVISELQRLWSKRALQPHLFVELIYSVSTDGKRFYKLCDIAHQVSEDVIEKRRGELERDPSLASQKKVKDFLDLLLSARDDDGQGLSPVELRNEVDTFMFAGHDTTASAMTWTLYALAGHPECQERVYEEINQLLGDRQDLEWGDLANLEYTTMCLKEAIRLHGPVPLIERLTSEDLSINGTIIPAGTRVAFYLYVLHNNPHIWDEPHEFRPDRFHPDKQRHMDPFQYIPFSAGARNCIGQNFAMNEMKTTIVKVIRKFQLSLDPQNQARRNNVVTMKPENGVYLYATPRS
ncbi:unnamed protein product [Candidula unifasciata]|uniref:Cytochrome P450 n=1 Tax=Candidula unifasciata TaxID=100452 RepID=A0A8S3YK98_9EUPU|nr:unnamed protein product [Candidula unifasciata]